MNQENLIKYTYILQLTKAINFIMGSFYAPKLGNRALNFQLLY